jgi:signal transduction histidine kinase
MWHALGLRGRLTAALILTSALTLAVVSVALLVPLDRRLRGDAVRTLTETTLAARPTLGRVALRDVAPGNHVLQDAVEDVRRRTGAEVAAVDATGRVLAATEPDTGESFPDVVRALRGDRLVSGTVATAEGPEASVAVPVRLRERPYALSMRRPLGSVAGASGVVGRGLLFAAAAAMALALLTGIWIATRLVRRLDRLRDAVLRVGEDEAADAADATRDEVGDLARAFAAMQRRVSEQEQARRTFVATASHELRTPLASLRLMLGMLEEELREEAPDVADARGQVRRASAQADRLSRLATDLLDLSRLDAVVELREEPVDLGEVVRAVLAEFDGAVLEPGGGEEPWALADPGAVARILRILLDNALRFAPAGTEVAVALRGGAHCTVAVADRGPGIAPEEREWIFERFARGSHARAGGFGLGLAIGRELAARMGGELRLDDAAPEPGARFVLELPVAARTAALAPAGPPRA